MREWQAGKPHPVITSNTRLAVRSFTPELMLTGFGGRFLIYFDESDYDLNEEYMEACYQPIPQHIIETLRRWKSLKSPQHEEKPRPILISVSNTA